MSTEIGRRGIRGIDNALFVTGAIQVTGKVSEEILKTLGSVSILRERKSKDEEVEVFL